jgi:hypothetical protein
MTRWVEDPSGGRARGPRAAARAWVEVLVRPLRFFRTGIAPGDQGPGFVFTVAVAAVAAGSHLALVPAARPTVGGGTLAPSLLLWAVVSVLAAPLALHLVAAVETVGLLLLADDRGTISETVQVLAYATAPCVFAGLPVPALRLAATGYGAVLLLVGTRAVHDLSWPVAVAVTAVPAWLVFGLAYRGVSAAVALAAT